MHGGVKVYRGAAAAARAYVEADRSRVDDYYLAEGSGLARWFGAVPGERVQDLGLLDGEGYEQWVAGRDPVTGQARGRLRHDGSAVRFVEVTVNGPKTWSLAAALVPEVAAAYDAAQERAAEQVIGWVAEHATTRVGPRGRQVQVPVENLEATVVQHYTSRAGDPHRHLHLQVNARVFAKGQWRGLHTVGFRDSIEALNGVGHAAVMTDPEFRAALAAAGFTLDPATGEVAELAPYVGAFSERAAQIGRNIDRYEAEWRAENPGQEPGPTVRRSWDRRAWKDTRPDKIAPRDGAELVAAWNHQIRQAERDAGAAYDHAQRSRTQLENAMHADLRPYRQAAHVRDADGRLTAVADELAGVEQELRTATARVHELASDPSIRTLPGEGLEGEHDRWAADRLARQQAATRQTRVHRRETARRAEPPPPSRNSPDRGLGIGR